MRSYNFNLDFPKGWADSPLSGELYVKQIGGVNHISKIGVGNHYRLYRIHRTRLGEDEYGLEFIFSNKTSPRYLYLRYPVKEGVHLRDVLAWPDPYDVFSFDYELNSFLVLARRKRTTQAYTEDDIHFIKNEVKAIFTKYFGEMLDMETFGLPGDVKV